MNAKAAEVIAEVFGDARRLGQFVRFAPAELKHDRVLGLMKADQPLAVAMDHGIRRHHFRPQQRPF